MANNKLAVTQDVIIYQPLSLNIVIYFYFFMLGPV